MLFFFLASIVARFYAVFCFQMLDYAVVGFSSIDFSKIAALTLQCLYAEGNDECDELASIQLLWNNIYISTTLLVNSVKKVPIIPTALAKTLAGSSNLLQEDIVKTG